MNPYYSKKWTLFTERPMPLLKRDLMSRCYYNLSSLSRALPGMKISKLLSIGWENNNLVFVPANEENKNRRLARERLAVKKLPKILAKFIQRIKKFKNLKKTAIAGAKYHFESLGPILVSTFYFERVLEDASNGLTALERDKLIVQVSHLRDLGAKKMYPGYDLACRYFTRLFPHQDFTYSLVAELERGKLNNNETTRRKEFYLAVFARGQAKVYAGTATRALLKKEGFKKVKIKNSKIIKGTPVNRGKVRATAVLILHLDDFKTKSVVNKVVICPETIIEYTPYLKQAKALVTDQGGLTCHAAIVSRELKIPCVVGTKIATKVFKDGDMVEVDAEKGIAKRIS